MKVINVSSGADGGQFHHENGLSTAFIFLLGLSGAAQRQTGAVSSGNRYIHCIYFPLTAIGKLWGSRGLSEVLRGSPGGYRGQFYW